MFTNKTSSDIKHTGSRPVAEPVKPVEPVEPVEPLEPVVPIKKQN